MTSSINIYAGQNARKTLLEQGINPIQFDVVAGASGGPKWFTLFGLDKYLFGDFFADRRSPLHTIGSSAGSWRMACLAQQDPVAAIERLAHFYSNETYSDKPDVNEISDKAERMLKRVLGKTGAKDIADNSTIQSHFIIAKAKGLNASENRLVQLTGLLTAATANSFSRNNIRHFFERYIVHTQNDQFDSSYFQLDDLPTRYASLTEENVHQTLMASGSIPLVLRGIPDIAGIEQGIYRDGGIIDYHLDLNFNSDGLVLYPHFFPIIKPGWFDKSLKSRKAKIKNYSNVVVITPSAEHVAKLPYQKISDRKDFENLDQNTRIKYWQTVLDESHRMADDFQALVENGQGIENILAVETILQ